jgi:hypothetical protein
MVFIFHCPYNNPDAAGGLLLAKQRTFFGAVQKSALAEER